jgi:hypothetical protein
MAAGLLLDDASPWRLAVVVTLAVAIEEAVRWWLYTLHRYVLGSLVCVATAALASPPALAPNCAYCYMQAHGAPFSKDSDEEPRLALQSGRSGGR